MEVEDGYRLQVQPEAVRVCAQALRQWAERWAELGKRAQAVGGQLAEATRAVPGERFGEIWTARAPRWAQKAERSRQLAMALEAGIARLEQAFQEAAQGLRALSLTPQGPLPEAPLAVDADGRPLASQFELRIDPAFLRQAGVPEETIARLHGRDREIRWYAACGPVALSVALSRLLGQPVPAQEVVNRMLAERIADSKFQGRIRNDAASRIQEGRPGMGFYTGELDLEAAARPYGAQVERISLPSGQQDRLQHERLFPRGDRLRRLPRRPGLCFRLLLRRLQGQHLSSLILSPMVSQPKGTGSRWRWKLIPMPGRPWTGSGYARICGSRMASDGWGRFRSGNRNAGSSGMLSGDAREKSSSSARM